MTLLFVSGEAGSRLDGDDRSHPDAAELDVG